MTLKAQPRSCVFSHLEVYVFSIIFSCITNLIFYMIGVMVYLPTVRFFQEYEEPVYSYSTLSR